MDPLRGEEPRRLPHQRTHSEGHFGTDDGWYFCEIRKNYLQVLGLKGKVEMITGQIAREPK